MRGHQSLYISTLDTPVYSWLLGHAFSKEYTQQGEPLWLALFI